MSDQNEFSLSFRYALGRLVLKNRMGDDVTVTLFKFTPNIIVHISNSIKPKLRLMIEIKVT